MIWSLVCEGNTPREEGLFNRKYTRPWFKHMVNGYRGSEVQWTMIMKRKTQIMCL